MHLKIDLYDINQKLLVPQGRKITEPLIHKLIHEGEMNPPQFVSVKDTPIIEDIDHAFSDQRYSLIFRSAATRKRIIDTLAQLKLEKPLFEELLYMKEYLPYTYKHVHILAAMTIIIAAQLSGSNYDPVLAAHLSFTHDIGKTRIPNEILDKPTALTEAESKIIISHPTIGYLLLNYYCGWEGKKYCWTAYEHHEKLDGSGYPRGITKIDPYAQLITPLDIFDALISDRPYRKTPFTARTAVDLLLDGVANGKLNKNIVYAIINCLRKHKTLPAAGFRTSAKKRGPVPKQNIYGIKSARKWLQKD